MLIKQQKDKDDSLVYLRQLRVGLSITIILVIEKLVNCFWKLLEFFVW